MRNAALVLGVIGGIVGMIVGFFGFGYVSLLEWSGEAERLATLSDPAMIKAVSFAAPILAVAGGSMPRSQAALGGTLMLASAAGMYWAFGFNVFTMFPLGMCGAGGVLALSARQPDAA